MEHCRAMQLSLLVVVYLDELWRNVAAHIFPHRVSRRIVAYCN
jgi:hypothetical protein